MSRHLESSTTTQMAKIMEKRGKIPLVIHERILYGHPLAGFQKERQFEEALLELGWKKIPNWDLHVRSSETKVISVSKCGWNYNGWKEAEDAFYVEEIDEKCGQWRANIISRPRVLGMHSTWMQTNWNNLMHIQRRGPIICKGHAQMRWEILRVGEQKDRAAQTMCGTILRICEQKWSTFVGTKFIQTTCEL